MHTDYPAGTPPALTHADQRVAAELGQVLRQLGAEHAIPAVLATLARCGQRARLSETARGIAAGLTERQAQMLDGMCRGLSNPEIGRELHLSEDTVKMYVRKLFRKLKCHDRAAAVAWGFRAGVLS